MYNEEYTLLKGDKKERKKERKKDRKK